MTSPPTIPVLGSTISLYLAEGRPDGIRIVQKDNWNGIGLDCSRADFPKARRRDEFDRSGVYLLLGDQDEGGGLPAIYLGETDGLGQRLTNHVKNKDFWTRLVIFTSKDDSINKAHARYLEARLYEVGAATKQGHFQNKVPPGRPKLNDQDRDLAERFLREMLVVLPVIGVRAFDAPTTTPSAASPRLLLKSNFAEASGEETSQGFKVLAGAVARPNETDKIRPGTRDLRHSLIENEVLKQTDGKLVLTQDYVFKSPSAAASVLVAGSINGREAWQSKDGRMLKDLQEGAVEEEVTESSPSEADHPPTGASLLGLPDGISEDDLPHLEDGQFPPNAVSQEERIRFRLALGIAQQTMGESDGPVVWQMARSIYNNPELPTN